MTLSDRPMCMIPHQSIGSRLSSLFLIRFFVELRVGNEKKHTYLAYIAKSKTIPNKENRSYNQIKMCMCVEFFLDGTCTLICMTLSFILRYGLSFFFIFYFSFSHAFGHKYFFFFFRIAHILFVI
jgi:hypothetical protein